MVGDGVNKDDNDVTAGDIITACQSVEQKTSAWSSSPSWQHRRKRERKRAKD